MGSVQNTQSNWSFFPTKSIKGLFSPDASKKAKFLGGFMAGFVALPALEVFAVSLLALQGGSQTETNYSLLGSVVLMPVIEEVVFRGVLQGGIKKVQALFSSRWADSSSGQATRIFLQATGFGLIHMQNGGEGGYFSNEEAIAQSITAAVAGIGLGYLKETSGSLLAPIGAHMGLNANFFNIRLE